MNQSGLNRKQTTIAIKQEGLPEFSFDSGRLNARIDEEIEKFSYLPGYPGRGTLILVGGDVITDCSDNLGEFVDKIDLTFCYKDSRIIRLIGTEKGIVIIPRVK